MMVYALTQIQWLFIIIASVVLAIIIFLLVFIPLVKLSHKRRYKNYYYKLIYKIALYNDYYLINNFSYRLDSNNITTIDHLIFGKKFIYVIMDKYFDGDLTGNASDPSLIMISKNGNRTYVDNPYAAFNKLLSTFSTATGVGTDLMVGVTIVNNNCRINISSSSKQFFLVQRKNFKKLVKIIEARDIEDINDEKLQKAVLTINNLNRKNLKAK